MPEVSKKKITQELRRCIQAENKEAVKIGDLERYMEAVKVVRRLFDMETYPATRIKEGADDLIWRPEEKGLELTFYGTKEIDSVKSGADAHRRGLACSM